MTDPRDPIEMPYGLWRSPLKLSELLSLPSAPMYPFRHRGLLHWLEALSQEDGRVALMRQRRSGERQCLTPAAFNIRTRVHEYGGRCFCVLGDQFIFNNLGDGRIYRQDLSADTPASPPPTPVTAAPAAGHSACFADLVPLSRSGASAVVAVMESGENGNGERDALVLVDLASEASRRGAARPEVLVEGGDFYACPVVSPEQTELAWLEWDKPFMPWDQSRLVTAELPALGDGGGGGGAGRALRNRRVLVDCAEQSVCQIGFLDDQSLLFVSDGNGADFWNFFRYKEGEIQQVTNDSCEYGEVHWVFGQRRWQPIAANKIAAVASAHDGDRLVEITLDSGSVSAARAPLAEAVAVCADLQANAPERELLWVARYADRGAEIRSLDLQSGADRPAGGQALTTVPAPAECSRPQPIAYPTRDGQQAYAYFYAPSNRRYRAPPGSMPPLLVVVHGGPTARATPEWHPLKQFFASLGYAILDINHRGSTGYGRAYRQSLLGQWGEIDATDIADGVAHLVAEKRVDPALVFIRGGSAGGYAVLRALTRFPQLFSGGACYYGIGNLITLAKITHKFEASYTDRLVGETFHPDTSADPASRFVQRSPVFQMERLACPLILFQGMDDKVVPPAVSREVADLLADKGIRHEYIEYKNEGHGFRRLQTRVDSLEKETAFFSMVIRGGG